jgi:hypothetical protein
MVTTLYGLQLPSITGNRLWLPSDAGNVARVDGVQVHFFVFWHYKQGATYLSLV